MRTITLIATIALLTLCLALPAFAMTREHRCQVSFGPKTEVYSNLPHGMIRDLTLVLDSNGIKNLSFFMSMNGQGSLLIDDIYYVEGENDVKWRYSDRKRGLPITLSHSDPKYKEFLEEKLFIMGTGPVNWEAGRVVFKLRAGDIPFEMYWQLQKNEVYSPMYPEEECPEAGAGQQPTVPDAQPAPPLTDHH